MKEQLLKKVLSWWIIKDDENVVLSNVSAKEVIKVLKEIEDELKNTNQNNLVAQ